MKKVMIPALKFALFSVFLALGLWMANTIHDPFQDSQAAEPKFSLNNAPAGQNRLLLIVVDKLTNPPTLQSAWWIGTRLDLPTAMVSVYPNVTQQKFRDDELSQSFQFSGMWSWRKPDSEFFDLLSEWDIHWDDYLVIDLAVQAALIDSFGGITIEGLRLSGKEANQQAKKLDSTSSQLTFQSRLWSSICSHASQRPGGFDLTVLPLNLNNHIITSLETKKTGAVNLFPGQLTFPVCMVNAGLMEAAVPPILPTK